MEKQNFVVNGGFKLPIGYRFRPTDEELVVHYLKRKVFGLPLPAAVIPEFDVFQADPSSLPGDEKEKRYFFSQRNGNYNHENKCRIAAGSGYWKSFGKDKQVVASGSRQAVGMKRTLVFCEGKPAHDAKTRWMMHEYRLVGGATNPRSTQMIAKIMGTGDWVVYRIFQRKRKLPKKKHGVVSNLPIAKNYNMINQTTIGLVRPVCIDFTIENSDSLGPPQPSSPCSSEITAEISSSMLDQEETSGCPCFSSYSCTRKRFN